MWAWPCHTKTQVGELGEGLVGRHLFHPLHHSFSHCEKMAQGTHAATGGCSWKKGAPHSLLQGVWGTQARSARQGSLFHPLIHSQLLLTIAKGLGAVLTGVHSSNLLDAMWECSPPSSLGQCCQEPNSIPSPSLKSAYLFS